jgi:hypothetical protein
MRRGKALFSFKKVKPPGPCDFAAGACWKRPGRANLNSSMLGRSSGKANSVVVVRSDFFG